MTSANKTCNPQQSRQQQSLPRLFRLPLFRQLQQLPAGLRLTLIYGLSLVATKAVALIMVPFTTHFLSPADYGRLDVLQTLADLLSIVIGMGLADTLFRHAGEEQSAEERRVIVANLTGMALLIGAATLLLTQLAAPAIAALLPGEISVTQTRLILGSLALGGISTLSLSWMRMCDQAGRFVIGSVGRVVLQALLAAALLIAGFGVTGVLAGGLIAAAVLFLWLFYRLWKDTGVRFDTGRIRQYSIYGAPLIFAGMSGFVLGSFDRWILADAVGTAQMAQYALAAKFGLITAMLIQPFDMWWLPRRFKVLSEADGAQRCARLGGIGVAVAITAAVVVAAIGPLLIEVLTPATYHRAASYVPWLAILAVLHSVNTTLGLGCYNAGTTTWPALIDAMAAAVAAAAYFLLIPPFGVSGAIAATLLALTLRLISTCLISQRISPLPYPWRRLLLLAAIAASVIALLQLADHSLHMLVLGLPATGLVLIGALLLGLMPSPAQLLRRQHSRSNA